MSDIIDTHGNVIPPSESLITDEQKQFGDDLHAIIAAHVETIGPYAVIGIVEVQKKLVTDAFRSRMEGSG